MHLPSETEAAQINQIVLDIDGDLERCEAEISSLNRVLADLGKRKKHLQSIRDNYRALLAPVRKLPVEILLEIFSYACVQNPSLSITSANYEDKLSMPTFHIARTCSQWRKIALSNPGLWSNITVDLAQRSWNVRDLVKLYLHRSGSTLLTLSIKAFRLHRDTPDSSAYHLQELGRESWELLGLLLKETSRWSRVSFDLAMNIYEDVNYVVHNEGVDTMPSLYSLPKLTHLEFEWDDWSGDDDNIPASFSSSHPRYLCAKFGYLCSITFSTLTNWSRQNYSIKVSLRWTCLFANALA
ncbi:hypothetical protein VKT23_003543 [Stygiomarasmius scandens]|uniref:F-box domain-containing protein n=1 Tax=Marasmiellus scandens TaxID=2682957 RepID=A0ABR1JY97_9AGAR